MSLNNPVWGEGFVPAYQMSATPFVTSSNVALGGIRQITFNSITKFVTIKNTGNIGSSIALGFSQNGFASGNFFPITGSETFTTEVRTDRIFISGSVGATTNFSLLAGLTSIPAKNFLVLTASNGFSGVG